MKYILQKMTNLVLLGVLFSLMACGGNSSFGGSGFNKGIDGTGVYTEGSITVIQTGVNVNGAEYDLTKSTILFDGEIENEEVLADGQIVLLKGTLEDNNTGRADSLVYISNVIGPITVIDTVNPSIEVLGQNIYIDESTVLGDGLSTLADFNSEQVIRVSGLRGVSGKIRATRIDAISTVSDYQVLGHISSLDTASSTFNINKLSVNYGNLNLDGVINNALIRVNGSSFNNAGELLASNIELVEIDYPDKDTIVDIDGIISRFTSPLDFDVLGFSVVPGDGIVSDTLSDLSLGARVRIKGKLNLQNVLIADQVTVLYTAPLSFSGLLNFGDSKTHKITVDDKSQGVWVEITGANGAGSFFVTKSGDDLFQAICQRHELYWFGDFSNNGLCYIDTRGVADLELTFISYASDTQYEISTFFRRAEFVSDTQLISVGQPLTIKQQMGDRFFYQLNNVSAPANSYIAVTVENLKNDGQLYIFDDDQSARNLDCILSNSNNRNICWFKADEIEHLYLTMESKVTKEYTLRAAYIVPTVLSATGTFSDTIPNIFGSLYKFNASIHDASVAVLVNNVLGGSTQLRLRPNSIPELHEYSCWSVQYRPERDQQCIIQNNDNTQWYLWVSGDIDATYDIAVHTLDQQPTERTMAVGDRIQADHQAGEIAVYRIPKSNIGSVFAAGLIDQTDDVDFELSLQRSFADYELSLQRSLADSESCLAQETNVDKRDCYLFTGDSPEEWYLTVKSASQGRYTLWTKEIEVIELISGMEYNDSIPLDNPEAGVLYRLPVPFAHSGVESSISNQSANIFLRGDYHDVTGSSIRFCLGENFCKYDSGVDGPGIWYILANGDAAASYTIKADIKD